MARRYEDVLEPYENEMRVRTSPRSWAGMVDQAGDDELIERYRAGDTRAMEVLLGRYRGFARVKVKSYFLVGADKEDIVQEGMIGLYKAIRDYSAEKEASFRSFAEICITRQIITAIKTATRQKHGPLNSYVSLTRPLGDDDGQDHLLQDVLEGPLMSDPAELVVASERVDSIRLAFAELLSDFEAEVLHLYVEGKSYQDIGERVGKHVKSIDNALQRIKRKIELHLREGDEDEEPEAAVGERASHGEAATRGLRTLWLAEGA